VTPTSSEIGMIPEYGIELQPIQPRGLEIARHAFGDKIREKV
jgi:hypothetical protein